ncbi:GTPase ObgE [Mycoplasma todarodis]|uniref:GTPase ObgE n=1 Tax=Mycoplasma todarodis TaxID=1937191 RepID=A0A4R0XVM2_9MOLU|nr:GTPase ObgE [Mycoplasma todarodis]TCG10991.1 GTPase ObgE [Mycoplasma todarodis]
MKFIDEAEIHVKAGKGGNGVVSFRREAHVSRGGPDGGDNTLLNLKLKRNIFGNDGEDGRRKNQYGAKGKDIFIKVPLGTLVMNGDKLLVDITEQKEYLIAAGGNGGKGNTKFKSRGDEFRLRLVLKVLADVGFVGKPSAGKSTLLSKVTNAKPKTAAYEFTTLNPQLGLSKVGENSFVVADLPGLIAGAAQGKGLGIEFLKHIERCRLIAHVIDFGDPIKDPVKDFEVINHELKEYSLGLEKRKQVVIANKADLEAFEENVKKFKKAHPEIELVEISALTEKGIEPLKHKLYDAYRAADEIEYKAKKSEVTITFEDDFIVEKEYEGMFEISGKEVERIYDKIPLSTGENFMRFNKKLSSLGVWDELRRQGVKDGDTVRIFSFEFEWSERN